MTRAAGLVTALAFALGLAGCIVRPDPLPAVAWSDLQDARRVLVERAAALDTVQAQCKLRFKPAAEGESTQTLDGAVVFDRQGQARLRTYKLGQMVFDVTVNDTGVWVAVSNEFKDRADDARDGLAKLGEALPALLRGPDFADARLTRTNSRGDLRAAWPDAEAAIDARTLAPKSFTFTGDAAEAIEKIDTVYADYGNGLWLHQLTAVGEFGTLTMTFRSVKLNGELNPRAFRQPRRAILADETDKANEKTGSDPVSGNEQP